MNTKIRTTIIASAAAIAAFSVPGVASAVVPIHRAGTVLQPRVVAPTTGITAREVGSAGVEGYDDKKCEGLEKDLETALNYSIDSYNDGDAQAGDSYHEQAKKIETQLTDNCLVVD